MRIRYFLYLPIVVSVVSLAAAAGPSQIFRSISQVDVPSANINQSQHQQHVKKHIHQFQTDLERVRKLPQSTLTTPCWLVSKDSTFTKSWTFDDWEKHQSQSLPRYARHLLTWIFSTTAYNIIPTIFIVVVWTVLLFKIKEGFEINMSATKFAMTLGFMQSPTLLLLTLKTNRALDRMLETRKAWGVLARATKTLTGMIATYIIPYNPEAGLIFVRYLTIIGWTLKAQFRRKDDDTDVISALFEQYPVEKEWLLNCPTKNPTAIVGRLRHLLSILGRNESEGGVSIPPVVMLRMEEILGEIEQTIGICIRVFLSPVPPTYTRHTSRVLVLYMFLLPAALVGAGVTQLPAIVTAVFATYVLVGIDEIGLESKCDRMAHIICNNRLISFALQYIIVQR